jgi:hypothetical protein
VKGLFSKEDHTNARAMAFYIQCTIFRPIVLVIQQCWAKAGGKDSKHDEKKAIMFRWQSALSLDLIETLRLTMHFSRSFCWGACEMNAPFEACVS